MASLQELAKKAGVSPSTASRVMNKYKGAFPISDKTREKVLKAAKKVGYVPNAAAQALRRGKTRTISVIGSGPHFFRISTQPGNFHMEAMSGLMHAAIKRGYHVNLLSGTETDPELGGAFADIGLADGLLIMNRDLDLDSDYISSLMNAGKPVMYALDYPDEKGIYYTAPDDVEGGRMATRRMLEKGHTKIAFLRQRFYANIFNRRQAGWEEEMEKAGVGSLKSMVFFVEEVDPVALKKEGYTAVLCANDSIARGFNQKLEDNGIKIKDEMALMVFTHQTEHQIFRVNYSSVAEPLATISASSVERLVDMIEGKKIKNAELFTYTYKDGNTL